jgi:hypothetical protein
VELVRRALEAGFTFRAVVADSFYGEDRGVRQGLRDLKVGYVLGLKPSHDWWHPIGSIGSLQEAAQAAGWRNVKHPGAWVKLVRTFRDGSQAIWWGLEVVAGPYGPHKQHRVVIATTDPVTLPKPSTMYLITNLPHPAHAEGHWSGLAPATLEEVVWVYGLRMWVEQSYKQVKHVLGWSEYQVRADRAMRRHWQLVCCAFCFCWHHLHDVAFLPATSPAPEQPRLAAAPPEKKVQRSGTASPGELARGAADRAGVARAVDTAAPLLARVVAGAPTPPTPAPA